MAPGAADVRPAVMSPGIQPAPSACNRVEIYVELRMQLQCAETTEVVAEQKKMSEEVPHWRPTPRACDVPEAAEQGSSRRCRRLG